MTRHTSWRKSAACLALFVLPALVCTLAFAAGKNNELPRITLPSGALATAKAHMVIVRPMPSFNLLSADDQTLAAQNLVDPGYWLIVYRSQSCAQCDGLMKALAAQPTYVSRIVFVIPDISGANLLLLEQQYPQLATARWLRDEKRAFFTSMNIGGSPHIFGMRGSGIRWQHAGAASSDPTLFAEINTWLGYNRLAPNKLTIATHKPPAKQSSAAPLSTPAPSAGQRTASGQGGASK